MTAEAQALAPGWVAWVVYGLICLPVLWALRPRRSDRPAAEPFRQRNTSATHVARDEHPRLHGPAVKRCTR